MPRLAKNLSTGWGVSNGILFENQFYQGEFNYVKSKFRFSIGNIFCVLYPIFKILAWVIEKLWLMKHELIDNHFLSNGKLNGILL